MRAFSSFVVAIVAAAGVVSSAQTVDSRPTMDRQAESNAEVSRLVSPVPASGYGNLPLSFEANQGQIDSQIRYLARGEGYALFLTDSSAVLALSKRSTAAKKQLSTGLQREQTHVAATTDVVRMELAGASHGFEVTGTDRLPGIANYFVGSDPTKWHTNLPTYSKVKYSGVYPGVDLTYYGNQRQLEYDFIVAPNADPSPVRLHFAGARKLSIDQQGDLAIVAKNGEIAFHKPVVYQVKNGQRQLVAGRFALLAKNTVGFQLGNYDRTRELIIDPQLAYSTYLGGSGGVYPNAIAVDASGSAYITGYAFVPFPTSSNAFEKAGPSAQLGNSVTFVSKLNPAGTSLDYSTYLFGDDTYTENSEGGSGIAIDQHGDAYVVGFTYSRSFPTTANAFQKTSKIPDTGNRIGTTGFLTKLNPYGSALVFSTYLGGSGGLSISGVALDASGNTYVIGAADSSDFPTTPGAFQPSPGTTQFPGFVTKFKNDGSGLVYSTLLHGETNSPVDSSEPTTLLDTIAVDSSGNAYVAGDTTAVDLPTTANAFLKTSTTGDSAFVTKFNADGTGLAYSTYLAGQKSNHYNAFCTGCALGIAVDGEGHAFVIGATTASDFPTTAGAFQTLNRAWRPKPSIPGANPFFTELNLDGSSLLYSTYIGGTGYGNTGGDIGTGIALDKLGNVYLAGETHSTDFPVTNGAFQISNNIYVRNSTQDSAFVSKFAFVGATTTTVAASPNPAPLGSTVTFTATTSAVDGGVVPAGTISFIINGNIAHVALDGAGQASYSTSGLALGQQTIVASYQGDMAASYSASSGTITETTTGGKAAPPTFLPVGGIYGASQRVTISSATAGATIYYTTGSSMPTASSIKYVSPVTVAATKTLRAIAVASGDTTSGIGTAAYTISPAAEPTTISVVSSSNPSKSGDAVTFTATVTPSVDDGPTSFNPAGAVTFRHGNVVIGTATLNQMAGFGTAASLTTSALTQAGNYSITATYSGSPTDASSTSPAVIQVVNP